MKKTHALQSRGKPAQAQKEAAPFGGGQTINQGGAKKKNPGGGGGGGGGGLRDH